MKSIYLYNFYKTKYGKELLIDVVDLAEIKSNLHKNPIHRLSYYDLTFITEGSEMMSLNNCSLKVQPGNVICSIPGDVWSWKKNTMLKGYALVFEEEFLLSFFNDQNFLKKYSFLNPERSSPLLSLDKKLSLQVLDCLIKIRAEIESLDDKDHHVLRALVYLALGLLERGQMVTVDKPLKSHGISLNRHINSFISLVNINFRLEREVGFYSDKLCITANYLNKITKDLLGVTAKQYIQSKLFQEAKNLLSYTTLSIEEISYILNFDNSSYFVRSFHRYIGTTPGQFRDHNKEK